MKNNILLILFIFLVVPFAYVQNKYYMGIPEGKDTLYDLIDKKAILAEENYRNVGNSASLKKFAPYPGSQGNYGTCAAWATTYCARTILQSILNNETDKNLITKNAYSPGFVYRLASSNKDCSGSFTTECARQMTQYGVPSLKEFNEPCPIYIPKEIFSLAENNKIKTFVKLWDDVFDINPKSKINLVKKSISEQLPVVISIHCPNSFQNPNGDLWEPTEDINAKVNHQHGRHALCVVGYDDFKYGGAFEIQNSWGTDWGNKGYVWVKYADFAKYAYQAIEMIGFEKYLNQEKKFSGGLKILLSDGTFISGKYENDYTYKLDQSLASGERFRLYLNSSEPTFLYSINIDSKGGIEKLFPYEDGISPILNYKNNDVPIPSEDKHLRLDGNIGKEYLCLIYSKKELDIKKIISSVANQPKTKSISQKFQFCFGENLILKSEIDFSYDSKGISFSTKSKDKDIMIVIIEINHIDQH
jgi:hypothetical protein